MLSPGEVLAGDSEEFNAELKRLKPCLTPEFQIERIIGKKHELEFAGSAEKRDNE